MKHDEARQFVSDWRALTPAERARSLTVLHDDFQPACEKFARDPSMAWPKGLRVKRVQGAPGVWEMTWSFAGPDGRATFEWILIEGELAIRWRRIGGHDVFQRP